MAARQDKRLNAAIEEAFYQKAVGGLVQREEKTVTEDDGKGCVKEKREVIVRQPPPDLDAIKAWLKERAPERWRGDGDKGAAAGNVIRVVTCAPRPEDEE
ncbi:MAG: hypothetical protein RSJ41_00300 [Clostridia bacterium]